MQSLKRASAASSEHTASFLDISPIKAGFISLIIFLAIALVIVGALTRHTISDLRGKALTDATIIAQELELIVKQRAATTHALAALIELHDDSEENFSKAIKSFILPTAPGITSVVIAPNGVVEQFYSALGFTGIEGVNLLTTPDQSNASKLAKQTGQLTVTEPFTFLNGELGIVARLPVFDSNNELRTFWGFIDVAMHVDEVLQSAQITKLDNLHYRYAIWYQSDQNKKEMLLASSSKALWSDPVEYSIELPNSEWLIQLTPSLGWLTWPELILRVTVAVLICLLLSLLTAAFFLLRRYGAGLHAQLIEGNAKFRMAESQLEGTFNAIPDLVWLKDRDGVFLNCNHKFEKLYGEKKANIIGNTDDKFVSKELAESFRRSDQIAMEADSPQTNEETLTFSDGGYTGLFESIKTPLIDSSGQLIGVLGIARDITEHRQRQETLRDSETRLQIILESTGIGIWDWDVNKDSWVASPTYYQILGYPPVFGKGNRQQELAKVHPDDVEKVWARINGILTGQSMEYTYEARMRHADGSFVWIGVRGKVIEVNENGTASRLVGVRMDIDYRRKAEERMHWLAHTDTLTGLPNRAALQSQLLCVLKAAQKKPVPVAIMFIDLDHFKNVNDALGHSTGDELLKSVAQRIQQAITKEGFVARQGGDEFIAVLPEVDFDNASAKALQLIDVLSAPHKIRQYELVVTPSIGISLFPRDGHDYQTLLKCADVAMYSAKREGRNNFQFFSYHMQAQAERTAKIESALRRAIDNKEIRIFYQPQISLETGDVASVEALLRWHHPELGDVSPAEFIPIAEDSGQILKIGEWALTQVAKQMRSWLDAGLPLKVAAVNLSAIQFRHPNFVKQVTHILADARLNAHYLELELTERIAMDNPDEAIAIMENLSKAGIRLSIDDFGTGYSSLNYLKRFKISKLKIDQSFVKTIPTENKDMAIISAIIDLAENLELQTVAEGVETEQQLKFLYNQGCTQVQGHYFSPAMNSAELSSFVLRQTDTEMDDELV